MLIEEYDMAMLTAALKHIAADLHMRETDLGFYLGLIRLGALPAFFVVPLADRVGRRKVFLWSLALTGGLTFLTAFSQTAMQFVLLQMLTRTFFVAGAAISIVIITEEFPAAHRGWGIGLLGALGSVGHGIAAGLFASIERLPFGWRFLYAVGVVALLLLPLFRRSLRETKRFEALQLQADRTRTDRAGWLGWAAPLKELACTHPGRATGVALLGLLPSIGIVAAFQFTGYFTQKVHGWSPPQYSAMVIVGGLVGIVGNVVAGSLGDRIGRRLVGFVMLAFFPGFVALFYWGPSWCLPFAWVAFLFCSQGGRVTLRAIATELFPTSHRGAASGVFNVLDVTGAALGLFLLYFTSDQPGDQARLMPYLALATLVGGALLLAFPETRQRELESISSSDSDADSASASDTEESRS